MKSDTISVSTLNKDHKLEELLKETRETIATEFKQDDLNRSFGIVDMWNRQKRQRTSLQMRRWLN